LRHHARCGGSNRPTKGRRDHSDQSKEHHLRGRCRARGERHRQPWCISQRCRGATGAVPGLAIRSPMTSRERYSSPLAERYASRAMLELWSPQTRHTTWRELWLALAESEHELGVPIPDEAIAQMRAHLTDIDFDAVADYEKRFRHDVMAHIHAFG